MKKIIVVKKTKDDTSDAKFWSKQSIEKRIQALEETAHKTPKGREDNDPRHLDTPDYE